MKAPVKKTKTKSPLTMGAQVLVTSVTFFYVGRIVAVCSDWIGLEQASRVYDTGRFHDALKKGTLNEVEPYPDGCLINRGAVVDICPWPHGLPVTQK